MAEPCCAWMAFLQRLVLADGNILEPGRLCSAKNNSTSSRVTPKACFLHDVPWLPFSASM